MPDTSARVAVLDSTVATMGATVKEDHERLRDMGEKLVAMDGKLDTLLDKAEKHAAVEERVRSLEDWRTGLVARMSVILVIAAFVSSVLTAVAVKWISGAVVPAQPVHISPIEPSREDARRIYLP